MDNQQVRDTEAQGAPVAVGPYPHARQFGSLLFLSGLGPRLPGSGDIPGLELDEAGHVVRYDFEAECRSVFANVKQVLEEAGSSWDHILDVTVFLTNMADDFATLNKIYAEHFTTNRPTRTTVEINCLPTPISIELKVIAAMPTSA